MTEGVGSTTENATVAVALVRGVAELEYTRDDGPDRVACCKQFARAPQKDRESFGNTHGDVGAGTGR